MARDHEYKRHGTVSLLAGIDLLTGQVHALVKDRHRSREFIEFLKLLDAAYPTHTAIKLILDNHSAHISKETKAWLADQPAGRFEFIFTPKHGSWLNLVEGFFSKLARSVLRHIRVASKGELKDREARVAVVEADDAKAAAGEPLAKRLRPGDQLHAEAHDEQDDRRVGRAYFLVFDGDAVGLDRSHLLASYPAAPPPKNALPMPPQPRTVAIPPIERTSARGKNCAPLVRGATSLQKLSRPRVAGKG